LRFFLAAFVLLFAAASRASSLGDLLYFCRLLPALEHAAFWVGGVWLLFLYFLWLLWLFGFGRLFLVPGSLGIFSMAGFLPPVRLYSRICQLFLRLSRFRILYLLDLGFPFFLAFGFVGFFLGLVVWAPFMFWILASSRALWAF